MGAGVGGMSGEALLVGELGDVLWAPRRGSDKVNVAETGARVGVQVGHQARPDDPYAEAGRQSLRSSPVCQDTTRAEALKIEE